MSAPTLDDTTVIWGTDSDIDFTVTIPPGVPADPPPPNTTLEYWLDVRTADGLTLFSYTDPQPHWRVTSDGLQVLGTVLIARSPAVYDSTAQDGYGYSGLGTYRAYGRYRDTNQDLVPAADFDIQLGDLYVQFARAPQPGPRYFAGQPESGCGCCPPWAPTGGGAPAEDAVLVYGDQQIAGQKDFTEMPTVDGIPMTAHASVWFTGQGPPVDPYPGADINDYYLDTVSGDVWQLSAGTGATGTTWSVTAHVTEAQNTEGLAATPITGLTPR